jgi:hypothetical protein
MKYKQFDSTALGKAGRVFFGASLMVLSGCAEWSSAPRRMEVDYGLSVRNMVNNQIYDPYKAQHPEVMAPNGMEGNKGDAVLNEVYRGDIGDPKTIKIHSLLGTPGLSSGGR